MKPINEMTLAECLEELSNGSGNDYMSFNDTRKIADRIHKLTRWIPVSERMPTQEDFGNEIFRVWINGTDERACFDCGKLLVWENDPYNAGWCEYDKGNWKTDFTHWQRITPPEEV
jgi:hypothetical protein